MLATMLTECCAKPAAETSIKETISDSTAAHMGSEMAWKAFGILVAALLKISDMSEIHLTLGCRSGADN